MRLALAKEHAGAIDRTNGWRGVRDTASVGELANLPSAAAHGLLALMFVVLFAAVFVPAKCVRRAPPARRLARAARHRGFATRFRRARERARRGECAAEAIPLSPPQIIPRSQ